MTPEEQAEYRRQIEAMDKFMGGRSVAAANGDASSDKRHHQVVDMQPAEWDQRPRGLAGEIRNFLKSLKDAGTSVDSGGGDGSADLWVTSDGIEYFISIRRSNRQIARDGKPVPQDK